MSAISADMNSEITCTEAREAGLYLLPMPVDIEGQTYLEGEDMDSAHLYDAMWQHRAVSTAQPSPGQVMELWDGIFAEGFDEIVHIPMSSGLSDSCENAAQLGASYGGRVQVADNHRISVTQRESVFSALRLAQEGAGDGAPAQAGSDHSGRQTGRLRKVERRGHGRKKDAGSHPTGSHGALCFGTGLPASD